jgi:hypothetical protein
MKTALTMSLAGLAACLAHGCTGESTAGLALPDLAAQQWKHRVLIIDTPMTTDALFALIDAMPMRQDEMSNR